MLWLYLHFPQLQLDTLTEAAIKDDQADSRKALIVFNTQNQQVYQRNEPAQAYKISVGMGLGTAASLCPELDVVEYQIELEQKRLKEIAQWLYDWTAEIVLFAPEGLALRVTPMLALYGELQQYEDAIHQALEPQALTYQYAFAHTPLAARLLARQGISSEAEISTNKQNSYNLYLQRLAITQFELNDKHTQALTRVGIRQVKQMLAIPRSELGKRFGPELLNYLEEVLGERRGAYSFFTPPPHFEMSAPLTHEIEQAPSLIFPSKTLLQKLEHYCQRRALYLASLQIQLLGRNKAITPIHLMSAEPCYKASTWLNLLNLKLESLHLESPVTDIEVIAKQWVEATPHQSSLFEKQGAQMSAKQVISRLEAKLGEQSVKQLSIFDDHRPEEASRYTSIHQTNAYNPTQRSSESLAPRKTLSNNNKSPLRPSLLLDTPKVLTENIQIIHGPERIESAWWDQGKAICRDYFVALSTHQERLWVFRDREQNWFVHGYFS